MNAASDFLPLQIGHHLDADPEWFNRHWHRNQESGFLERLPLLFLHQLLDGLQRRIIDRVGVEEFEADLEDLLADSIDCDSALLRCPRTWLDNYQLIVARVARLEWREIEQQKWRAA